MTAAVDPGAWLEGTGRGSDPAALADELLWYIGQAVAAHPRSLQRRLGPSEIGHPCTRKLGYRLLGRLGETRSVPWLPTIGTAVHAWLAEAFTQEAIAERFLVEHRVVAGTIHGELLTGSVDLYDRITGTVVDWKIVGPYTLRQVLASGASAQYRAQIQTYGYGLAAQGHPVERVLIMFLPRNGPLNEAVPWGAAYDPAQAQAAIDRANGIALAVDQLGDEAVRILPTADAYCHLCEFYAPRSTNPVVGCAGHPRPLPDQSGPAFGPITPGGTR